jgi:hypothetical protein
MLRFVDCFPIRALPGWVNVYEYSRPVAEVPTQPTWLLNSGHTH